MRAESNSPLFLLCNGEMLPADDAVLPVADRAVAFGAGVFETIAAYDGTPFAFEKHIARLCAGMEYFGIDLELPVDLEQQLRELIEKNQLTKECPARVRLTVTAGPVSGTPCWILEATSAPQHASVAALITGPFVRNDQSPLSAFKTINYGDNHAAMQAAKRAGATEALFSNTHGNLCEGTWSNFFFLHEGIWKTPPLSSGCLPGTTRDTVLKLAKESGIKIEEADLPLTRVTEIESAFLTSTMRGIQPVLKIDGHNLRDSAGEWHALANAYQKLVGG